MIPHDKYIDIIKNVPILCVDIIMKNKEEKFLLAKRMNEPLKGEWWVIGGRVLKGETLLQAAARKTVEELGVHLKDFRIVGVYEDFFDKNSMSLDSLYHTLAVVLQVSLPEDLAVKLDSQHDKWGFFDKLPPRFKVVPINSI